MASGKLVRIAPDGTIAETHVPEKKGPSLALLQDKVGGYIELVKVRYDGTVRTAYVDEDGRSKSLLPNPHATVLCVNDHRLFGPLVIWIPDHKGSKHAN